MRPLRIAVLASGEGTTLEGVAAALSSEAATAEITVVLSDRPRARALVRARGLGLRVRVVEPAGDPERWGARLTQELEAHGVELVVLAGFLAILPASWVERWRGRAINVHPSLLPRYGGRGMYGLRVHAAVLAAGERETGATVHLVTGTIDGGPPIAQERFPIPSGATPESLRERLRPVEVELLARTIRRFADGSLPLPYPGGADRAEAARPA